MLLFMLKISAAAFVNTELNKWFVQLLSKLNKNNNNNDRVSPQLRVWLTETSCGRISDYTAVVEDRQ